MQLVNVQQIKIKRKMNYTFINPEIEAQITEIKLKIRLSMNGIVSDQMIRNGIVYQKNFGVSIPRIKEIASNYTPNHSLALQLWNLHIRETMIMSTLLEPVGEFTIQSAGILVSQINQIEIAEQACMNLFCKLPFASELSKEWVQSVTIWEQITGFLLAARMYESLNRDVLHAIISRGFDVSTTTDFHLYKAVALCLSRFCRKDKETAAYILKQLTALEPISSTGRLYISNEVKQEILFLNTL